MFAIIFNSTLVSAVFIDAEYKYPARSLAVEIVYTLFEATVFALGVVV